ncbi:MAG: hypothetical protein EZS28_011520 [Streblomastix strix]|uniref:Uncharacterized protein n=1 Tax=Streblomastix strix TaxID=222440 RepID=A0A5J4WEY5_9EUKA|nr:MAG: hypothetical protein EZS28_011520 [Streblomastix strix]
MFEAPKIGIQMQLYLPLISSKNLPYPPIVVSRVAGDSMKEWEDIKEYRKKSDQLQKKEIELKTLKRPKKKKQEQKQLLSKKSTIGGIPVQAEDDENNIDENDPELSLFMSKEGYPRKSLSFTCVPIKKRPVRTWRVGKGNWGKWLQFFGKKNMNDNEENENLGYNVTKNIIDGKSIIEDKGELSGVQLKKQKKKIDNTFDVNTVQANLENGWNRYKTSFGIADRKIVNLPTDKFIIARRQFDNRYEGKVGSIYAQLTKQPSMYQYPSSSPFTSTTSLETYSSSSQLQLEQLSPQNQFIWNGEQYWRYYLSLFCDLGDGDDLIGAKELQNQYQYAFKNNNNSQNNITSTLNQENKVQRLQNEIAGLFGTGDNNANPGQGANRIDPSYLPPLDRYSLILPQDESKYLLFQYEPTIIQNDQVPVDDQLLDILENEAEWKFILDDDSEDEIEIEKYTNEQLKGVHKKSRKDNKASFNEDYGDDVGFTSPTYGIRVLQHLITTQSAITKLKEVPNYTTRKDPLQPIYEQYQLQYNINLRKLYRRVSIIRNFDVNIEPNDEVSRIPRVDFTRGFHFPVQPMIPLPPYQVINQFYTTPLPPPLNDCIKADKEVKAMQDLKLGLDYQQNIQYNSEIISVSFVDTNGYGNLISTFFDPKLYFGGHPAIVCEFYAPIVRNDTSNALSGSEIQSQKV